jgi:hypothetical protein
VGRDSKYGVLINFESNINLGDAAGSWGDAGEVELAKHMVVLAESTLTFVDGDGNGGLLVTVGGEGLGLLAGDDSTTWDNLGHHSSDGLNTESKRGNIDEKKVLGLFGSLATEDSTLNSGTVSDSFVRVNTSVGFLAVEEFLNKLLDLGDTGRATDKDNFVDF